MSDSYEAVVNGPARIVCIDRPRMMNAVDTGFLKALPEECARTDSDPAVAAMILTGRGPHFSAGADLPEVEGLRHDPARLSDYLDLWHAAGSALREMSKPVVAGVQGFVLAGGLELVASCDLVVAAKGTRFGDAHATRGLVPGGGGTQLLPRLVGPRRALELMLTDRKLTAQEALEIGLVNRVVEDEQVLHECEALVGSIAAMGPQAVQHIKRLARLGDRAGFEEGLAAERQVVLRHLGQSEEVEEGIASFVERRDPSWVSRQGER